MKSPLYDLSAKVAGICIWSSELCLLRGTASSCLKKPNKCRIPWTIYSSSPCLTSLQLHSSETLERLDLGVDEVAMKRDEVAMKQICFNGTMKAPPSLQTTTLVYKPPRRFEAVHQYYA